MADMMRIKAFSEGHSSFDDVLRLPYEKRQKSRLRVQLVSGVEVGVTLPRGTVLRGGDVLLSENGKVIAVEAQPEKVSLVVSDDALLLTRAGYHLGNRHVPLSISKEGLSYLQDHVLDEMVLQLGLTIHYKTAPFEPESGAYGGGHHHS